MNNLERSDTLPLSFEDNFTGNSSFSERFNTKDLADILQTPQHDAMELDKPIPLQSSIWSELDIDTSFDAQKESISDSSVAGTSTPCQDTNVPVPMYDDANLATQQLIGNKQIVEIDGESYVLYEPKEEAIDTTVTNITLIEAENNVSNGVASLSFQPMPGPFDFNLHLDSNQHNNNKWCYSNSLEKLFAQNLIAVPVNITVDQWIASYVNITPVFVESQYQSMPVNRCHNHQKVDEDKNLPWAAHIVQVENSDAVYKISEDGRHSVDVPLGIPAPGDSAKTIYVKCGCWNTCVGGPGRKRFSLVFTLFDSQHYEVGRQSVTLKVCSCPKRDMELEEAKGSENKRKKLSPTKRLKTEERRTKKIKTEDETPKTVEQIPVPLEFVPEVKRFINQLVAEKKMKQNGLSKHLPFPNVYKDTQ